MDPGMVENMMKTLAGNDPEMLKQAEQYWKMLDDMAESDPKNYKNFVDTNIKNGQEDFQKQKEAVKEKNTVKINQVDYQFSIKIDASLENLFAPSTKEKDAKVNTKEEDFLQKILKEEKDGMLDKEEKFPANGVIYLNFIKSVHVKSILDAKYNPANIDDVKSWHYIPFTMSKPLSDVKPTALGSVDSINLYYNIVLNDVLIVKAQKENALWRPQLAYLLDAIQKRIGSDRNHIQGKTMKSAKQELQYYKFKIDTFKFFKGYKGPSGKDSKMPKKIEIEVLPDQVEPNKKPDAPKNMFGDTNMKPSEIINSMLFKFFY